MSLVGTRPILQDELLKYELHHRARIAINRYIKSMTTLVVPGVVLHKRESIID